MYVALDASPPDASPLDASSFDATLGAPDADPCAACTTSSECMDPVCDGTCEERPVADGTTCGGTDTMICVTGACIPRTCGDGYREPGPTPAREGCDDGNAVGGDACSAACEPDLLVIAARMDESDVPIGGAAPAVAVDGTGAALVVWKASGAGSSYSVQARRFSPGGVPLDATPITIVPGLITGYEAEPTVAGRATGWVIVSRSQTIDSDGTGVAYALMESDGTLGAADAANQSSFLNQEAASATGLPGGFAIVWEDMSMFSPGTHGRRIMARLFDDDGTPAGDEIEVSTSWEDHTSPAIAASGDRLLAVWTSTNVEGSTTTGVLGRRLQADGTPIDGTPFLLSDIDAVGDPVQSYGAAVGGLAGGGWGTAWTSRGDDYVGDVRARSVPVAGTVATSSTLVAGEVGVSERMPSVASLADTSYAVLWHQAGAGNVIVDVYLTPVDGVLAPEAADLATLLAAPGNQQTGSLAAAPGRLWVVWSDDGWMFGATRILDTCVLPVE